MTSDDLAARPGAGIAFVVAALLGAGCPSPPPPAKPTPEPTLPQPSSAELPGEAVVGVATFHEHHCLLRKAGTVSCWGKNTYGQLGNGAREDSAERVEVAGIDDAVAVAVGRDFSCVLRSGGMVACWGNDEDGQLGDGKGVEPGALSLVPVRVEGLRDVKQISLGEYHACALHDGGRVSCWGNGADGQIGSADQRAFGRPRAIEQLGDVAEIASGASHVCVRREDGRVMCWGRNTEGQLGADVSGSRTKPVRVEGLGDAVRLASGHHHSCAVREDGSVACWGDNKSMQLGPGAGADKRRKTPVSVAGLGDVAWLAAGGRHTCARRGSAEVVCWGDNTRGQLTGSEGPAVAEPVAAELGNGALQLSLGLAQSCAALEGGSAICWGATSMHVAAAKR